MKPILSLLLIFIFSGVLLAQNTADGMFVNPSRIASVPSQFGPQDLHIYDCGEDIIFDGSLSMGEDRYLIEIVEFDLATWTTGPVIFNNWICTSCTVPNNIDVIAYFGGQSPQCGQTYKLRLSTGPVWATTDRFFAVDCGNNGVPTVKTFDVFHRIHEDTLVDKLDYAASGVINQNGEYVSLGYASKTIPGANDDLELATVRYNLDGTVTSLPQLGVLPNSSFTNFAGAEEIVTAGAQDGYLYVTEINNGGEVTLVRKDAGGNVLWGDVVELYFNGSNVPVEALDFLIDGDRAVITGEAAFAVGTQPFILIYDYVSRSVVCSQVFNLRPTMTTFSRGTAIANNTNNSHYSIAGSLDNELFYLEVEYDCSYASSNTALFFPVDAVAATKPIPRQILFDNVQSSPIICGSLDGSGVNDMLFVQIGNQSTLIDPGTSDVSLHAAVLNQQNELILAGNVNDAGNQQGFIAAIDQYAYTTGNNALLWAKIYSDGQYPETNITDLDLDADGGYFTVGYGIQQNTTTGNFDFDFEFFDTWIMKTDEDGVLMNCNCYEEVSWVESDFNGIGGFSLLPLSTTTDVAFAPYVTEPLQDADYFCDQWCPPPSPSECLVGMSGTPTADTTDLCCYDISFFIDPIHADEFTEIQLVPVGATQLVPLTSLPGNYGFIQNTTSQISLISNVGNLCPGTVDRYFPTGTLASVELCVSDFTGAMPTVAANFLKCDGETCTDTLVLACNPCIEIVNDTMICAGGQLKYEFDFQNTWDRPITRLVVNNLATLGVSLNPDTLHFTPAIQVGNYAGQQSICVNTTLPVDSVKFDFKAFGIDDCCFCISDEICQPLPICCDTCESIDYIISDTIIGENECCYSLDIYHCTDSLFTALRVSTLGNVTLSNQSAGTNWSMLIPGASSNTSQTYFPRPTPIHATPIPTGWSRSKVNFCLGNINSPADVPQTVTLEWLAGSDTSVICQDTMIFECQPPGPDTNCVALVDTLWDCLSPGIYQLDLDLEIKRPGTTYAAWITQYHSSPAGAVITPAPTLLQGNWGQGNIITMPSITVSNVNPGDSICFVLALSDTILTGQNIQECCYSDTICLVVPPCDAVSMGYDCDTLDLPDYDHDYLGWAAVTCFSGFNTPQQAGSGINNGGYVMGLIDVTANGSAPLGSPWSPTMKHDPVFTADSLGQIFGLAVDENACVYVTASSLYGNQLTQPTFSWGSAGPGGVYQLCPDATGTYQKTNQLSLPNTSSGLGQVTYDPVHRQLFVSNFSDGLIYRIDIASWSVNNTYDFPGYATGSATTQPDFVALGERVWAVEYNIFENRLYFAIWGEDQRNMFDPASTNQLWRIDLDAAGNFSGPASYVLDLPGRDYNGTQVTTQTAPISDLAFSKEGRMLVSERTLRDDYVDQPHVNWPGHGARMYSYELAAGNWVSPRLHYIGFALSFYGDDNANSSGGCDFGYLDSNTGCDSMLWTTGDYLSNTNSVYGLQAHQWPGNSNVSTAPDYVLTNSITIDLDGNLFNSAKVQNGDVEIFRAPCCSEPVIEPDCCQDEPGFRNAVQNGFQIVFNGNMVTVDNPLLDSCNTLDIDWGDGMFDQILASNLPISHTYLNPAANDLCILVTETAADGTLCWEEVYCTPIISDEPGCEACPDELSWMVLDSSPSTAFFELHNFQNQLYIGTYFGGVNGVGRYDGTSWVAIPPSGFSADFEDLFVHQGQLWAVVAIRNVATGQVTDYDLARWDETSLDWARQNLDLDIVAFSDYGRIYTAVSYGSEIAIGGYFDQINGSLAAHNIGLWSPVTGNWSTLNASFDEQVSGLTVYNSDLIAAGGFQVPHNQISRWDGSNWQAMGGGLTPHPFMPTINRRVTAFEEINGQLYVGGRFSNALNPGNVTVNGTRGMAIWDGTNWSSFGGGITSSYIYHQANSFKQIGNDIYVAGYYAGIGGQTITGISRYDGTNFVATNFGGQLEVYDIECVADAAGHCEIYAGAEQRFGKLFCDIIDATNEAILSDIPVVLYPNPTHGRVELQFDLERGGATQISVLTLQGRKVYQRELHLLPGQQNIQLELGDLPDGSYLVRLSGSGIQAIRKLVKIR